MKKATMTTILSLIAAIDTPEAEEVRTELEAELGKGKARAEANANLYEAAKAVVMGALEDKPATIGELYEAIEDELPEGFTKGKLQYAMTRLWANEIVKHEGKINMYSKK